MELWEQEKKLWKEGYQSVAGVDEVGRGCLSGPVITCAYIVQPLETALPAVRDSKALTHQRRSVLYRTLLHCSSDFAIGYASAAEVDELNVREATLLAMGRALRALGTQPDYALIDGNMAPESGIPTRTVIKGDARVGSIAAASIIAKVTRDSLMMQAHKHFPDYCFDRNKGYGTAVHLDALRKVGPCPLHRRTFSGVYQPTLGFPEENREVRQ